MENQCPDCETLNPEGARFCRKCGRTLLDFTVNGRASRRDGYPPGNRTHWPGTPLVNNYRGPTVAPHNAYRTHPGDYNDWCVIVCHSDEEWQRLAWAGALVLVGLISIFSLLARWVTRDRLAGSR